MPESEMEGQTTRNSFPAADDDTARAVGEKGLFDSDCFLHCVVLDRIDGCEFS
jgi:hypothetical protein